MRSAAEERETWRAKERRKEERHTLILRAGLLEEAERTSFCLVKNISIAGVQLKVYAKLTLNAEVKLHVADESPIAGHIAWINGDNAGMSLRDELDAATLLRVQQKLKPNKRRALPRMKIEASALLKTGGRLIRANVRDVSSFGARVSAQCELQAGDQTLVEFADLPAVSAFVRWVDDAELGLSFETPIPMQIIAQWIEGRGRAMP